MQIHKNFSVILFCIVLLFGLIFSVDIFADLPPDPGTGGPGTGDIPVGGGSPIDGGLILLISLGITYGVKKVFGRNNLKGH
jgi:hypothetical protein